MNWTLRQMEILVAAAEAATFSAAARKLGISQPSLSESIRRIELAIGVVLFARTTRSLKLTEDGRRAAVIARELMQDFKRGLESLTAGTGGGRIARAKVHLRRHPCDQRFRAGFAIHQLKLRKRLGSDENGDMTLAE